VPAPASVAPSAAVPDSAARSPLASYGEGAA